ncbi:MAG: hypothetical protein M0R33_09805 [Methylomonas sp.]|jgi:hypothetical protein|uniref:hypothetical protein n=1 Tax=Methylomonas sp. TaxID=418 RepID=UPI0025E8EB65|nr:hypothetical protein [Methylomonas sp.]MCK9606725.1 hypothetical protein [Methylomonas sp.]
MFTQKWGDAYYSHDIGPDADSNSARHWIENLERYQPDLKQRVQRTVDQWNLIVRDQLRNETALRLNIESKSNHTENKNIQIPIKVVDGLPEPLIDILRRYSEQAPILLNEKSFADTASGLDIAIEQFSALQTLCPSPISQSDLGNVTGWFQQILEQLKQIDLKQRLRNLDQDILGAYFLNSPRVEIYWVAIGIYAQLYSISIEGLCLVVLAHELAHAYTHRGKDIDGTTWETKDFGNADLGIVEGLAQFYTKTVCEKLAARFPAALEAYQALLQTQSPIYTEHEQWIEYHPQIEQHLKEAVRFSMIQCRSEGIVRYDEFMRVLHDVGNFPFSR